MNGSNEITYLYFCTLDALGNPKCTQVIHRNGSYIYFTYHLLASTEGSNISTH